MTTDQLSMSMFASRADYDAAVRAQVEQLPDGLQQTGVNSPFNACMYRDDCRSEHAQRVTLQHHAADQAQRIADLETRCATLKRLHDAVADERDEWRRIASAYSPQKELSTALEQARASGRQARKERDELRARLAELESQEPVPDDGIRFLDCPPRPRPVPAQAVPDADGARFRWLCEDHSDRETRERCRSLIDRLPVMSYSDAVMSIDAAMAAAPEHKA